MKNKLSFVTLSLLSSIVFIPSVFAKDITLRYSIWDRNQLQVEETLIKKFEEQNPGIKISLDLITPSKEYWVKLGAATAGGVAPDVFWINMPRFKQYANNDLLEPLDNYIDNSGFDTDAIIKSSLNAYKHNDNQLSIPRDIDSIALWFNKKLFDEAGVSYPTNDWNWDDLRQTAEKLHQKLGDKAYPIVLELNREGQDSYLNLLYQAGLNIVPANGQPTDIASDKAIWVYEELQDMMKDGSLPSIEQMSEITPQDVFQSNRAAMVYAGSWFSGPFSKNELIKDHIGVVKMPKIEREATVSHSIGLAISANSENKDAAWKFVSFMTSEASQAEISKVVIPANKNVAGKWTESIDNIDVSAHVEALEFSLPYPVAGTNNPKWQDLWKSALNKIFLGGDARKEMDNVINRIEKQMSQ
ncbi:ABC transporter substrate-binding protein [Thorsellia kenyensis]|uniref:sn-glycerol-3-phosphate-binding periplasmic protein UgpB n=1 Tax=Thorsellia kenyensis TaxID=1549888 RepID=A0ABV6CB50_9GAMM